MASGAEPGLNIGVASCASGVCHGRTVPRPDATVRLNEYATWSQNYHARAYRTLASDESKRIARNLGLASAQTADICLDCHANNVSSEARADKFQISDGVSCEACHGAASGWIDSHTEPGATHAANLALGLYPTEDPVTRARLCLSCHLGTARKYATHRIMGAGHPRLIFELDWFSTNQPPHYDVDDDYRARKGAASGFRLWLTGQVEAARAYLDVIDARLDGSKLVPELALYDCHACHHPMSDLRWNPANRARGVEPGSLRLQEQHFLMLEAAAGVLTPAAAARLGSLTGALVAAGGRDGAATKRAAAALRAWLDTEPARWLGRDFDGAEGRREAGQVRSALVRAAADGRYSDYVVAEQMVLSIESLSLYIGDAERIKGTLDALFDAVGTSEDHAPARFRQAAARAAGTL
jgi:hypothetical protein